MAPWSPKSTGKGLHDGAVWRMALSRNTFNLLIVPLVMENSWHLLAVTPLSTWQGAKCHGNLLFYSLFLETGSVAGSRQLDFSSRWELWGGDTGEEEEDKRKVLLLIYISSSF